MSDTYANMMVKYVTILVDLEAKKAKIVEDNKMVSTWSGTTSTEDIDIAIKAIEDLLKVLAESIGFNRLNQQLRDKIAKETERADGNFFEYQKLVMERSNGN